MIRLHHCRQSLSMRSHWLLNALGVPFEGGPHGVDTSLCDPDYLTLSSAGRAPALEAGRLERCCAATETRDAVRTSAGAAADVGVGPAVYMAQCLARLVGFAALSDRYQRSVGGPGSGRRCRRMRRWLTICRSMRPGRSRGAEAGI